MKRSPDWQKELEASEEKEKERERQAGGRKVGFVYELLDWVKYLLIGVVLTFLLMTFVLQRNLVQGLSMAPTLLPNEHLWIQKLSRYWGGLDRGDIVTIRSADLPNAKKRKDDYVKRIVGLPGELVEIREGRVWINRKPLDESYLPADVTTTVHGKTTFWRLEQDEYFVLGDNRANSLDSRQFGPVPLKAILGEVWFRMLPLDRFGAVD